MTIKTMTLVLVALTASIQLYAQDYYVVKKDTTFCTNLKYSTTAQGYLKSIKYTDKSGKETAIEGRENVPDVATFYIKGSFIDKTPLKADKPEGYIRYTGRAVDGKLKVYLERQGYRDGSVGLSGPSGIYRFYIKMPDGTFYQINNKKNMNEHIIPFLEQCSKFSEWYKGDYSTREEPFMEMIKQYNSSCK